MKHLGHTSANAVKATAGGWSTGSSTCSTFPLHSLMSSARREGSEYHFKVFDMTRPGLGPSSCACVKEKLTQARNFSAKEGYKEVVQRLS